MSNPKAATTSLLASFATLKSLSDEKKYKSPYHVLREFIGYIIDVEHLFSFTAVEMKALLNKHFSFQIPEAVIKTAAKNMPSVKAEKGTFSVLFDNGVKESLFIEKKKEADEYSTKLLTEISQYISKKQPNDTVNENTVLEDLISFLVDDYPSSTGMYTDLIGEFILKNENDEKIQRGLDRIREGSILYIGLSYNINETGSITKPLCLYLGTEIIFSLVGYNGTIHQQFADDFYNQIRLANSSGQKKISLYYFHDVKKEMDDFFKTAEGIIEGKVRQFLDKPAMKAITNGCNTAADITVKKADFYSKLRSLGIIEDTHGSYYDELDSSNNLEDLKYLNEEDEKRIAGIKFVSNINKLRNGKHCRNNLDSEYLLVTNTRATLSVSHEQSEQIRLNEGLDSICDFAVSLERITSLLWYKLGTGFSQQSFPSNVKALLKARVVLSASVAQKANQAYKEIKREYQEGSVSDDSVAARIHMLREKPQLPEELLASDIDDTMDFSMEYLSRYEEEHNNAQVALKDKEMIIVTLRDDMKNAIAEKDEKIAAHERVIREKTIENESLYSKLDEYRIKEQEAAERKQRRKNVFRFIWRCIWNIMILAGITAIAVLLLNKCSNKTVMIIAIVADLAGLAAMVPVAIKRYKREMQNTK